MAAKNRDDTERAMKRKEVEFMSLSQIKRTYRDPAWMSKYMDMKRYDKTGKEDRNG